MFELDTADIPVALIDQATKLTGNFLVGLVKLTTDGQRQDGELMGSGTLIRKGATHGILTARHVLDELPTEGQIGLILPKSIGVPQAAGKPVVLADSTHRIGFELGPTESLGPDLALLVLHPADVDRLRPTKSFFDLERWRSAVLGDQRDMAHQPHALAGFPDELTLVRGPEGGYDEVKEFNGRSFFDFIDVEPAAADFDYVNFVVGYGGAPGDPPRNFGGVSGGGLWHVELLGDTPAQIRLGNCLLSGVAFHQSEIVNNRSLIKCHWRRSIYEGLFKRIGPIA